MKLTLTRDGQVLVCRPNRSGRSPRVYGIRRWSTLAHATLRGQNALPVGRARSSRWSASCGSGREALTFRIPDFALGPTVLASKRQVYGESDGIAGRFVGNATLPCSFDLPQLFPARRALAILGASARSGCLKAK